MLRRHRVPTEERELLPLHRPSPSIASRPFSPPPLSVPLRNNVPVEPPTIIKRRETPHDVALAELNHRLTGRNGPPPSSSATKSPPTAAGAPTSRKKKSRHYSLPLPPTTQERIYDPYTGAYRGTLAPPERRSARADNTDGSGNETLPTTPTSTLMSADGTCSDSSGGESTVERRAADARRREIERLEALNRIREIQSQVARTQYAMENIGGGVGIGSGDKVDSTTRGGASNSATDLRPPLSSRPSIGKRGATRSNTDPKPDDKSDRDFPSHAPAKDSFAERREAIDKIVQHLEELSNAVQQFHQIPTPDFDFPSATARVLPIRTPSRERGYHFDTPHDPYLHPYGVERSSSPPTRSPYLSASRYTPALSPTSFTAANRARSLSPPPSTSPMSSRPTSISHVARGGTTLAPILDHQDDYHRRHWESPASTQSSFRMYA